MITHALPSASGDPGSPAFDDDLFAQIGERFKALGEPARLRILDALRRKELTVGELVSTTGLNQANASKHLQLLHRLGFVVRWKDGLFVYYRLADEDVFRLCDVMCGRIAQAQRANARRVTPRVERREAPRRRLARPQARGRSA
jgi:DNA-binding transcriptional ArsR family regulator